MNLTYDLLQSLLYDFDIYYHTIYMIWLFSFFVKALQHEINSSKVQFFRCESIAYVFQKIHTEFIDNPGDFEEAARDDYFKMKYCALLRKHLDKHYKRMSKVFYMLNGANDPNLKQ